MNPYIKSVGARALLFAGLSAAASVAIDIYKIYNPKKES